METIATGKGFDVSLIDSFDTNNSTLIVVKEETRVIVGTTVQLPCTVFPLFPETITYVSENELVGTVTGDGLFTAISPRITSITISANNVSASFAVTVTRPPIYATEFWLSDVWVVAKRSTRVFIEGLSPADADLDLIWQTGDVTYATVSDDGTITGNAVGETSITVTDSLTGLSSSAIIHTCYPVYAITFADAEVEIRFGKTVQLTAIASTIHDQSYENRLVTFTSSNESIATVSTNGVVRGIAPGTATIMATAVNDEAVTASCIVSIATPNTLILPTELNTIESGAFIGLPSVDAIHIPANVTSIATDAFDPGMVLFVSTGSDWVQWAEDHGYFPIEE